MLYGNLDVKERLFSPVLASAMEFLQQTAPGLPEGRHELGQGMYAVISAYSPSEAKDKLFETHIRHADLQYLIAGGEAIIVTPLAGLATVEDRLAADDIRFHAEPEQARITSISMRAGDYMLLMPDDAHKPACNDGFSHCRKCVVKIPVDLLIG